TKTKTMMMLELPKDLVEEILSRLPATTLKRLQSTCKQWTDIINDREFAGKHFSKAAKQHLVVMLKNFNVHLISVNVDGIHNDIDPSIKDIEIYDFNSSSWRTLNVTRIWPLISRVVSLKGNAYWFTYEYKEGVRNSSLLSFDFSKEIFGNICVPFQFNGDYLVELSVIRENKLAVLLQRWALEIEMWVTDNIEPNGNGVPWNHFLAVDLGVTIPPISDVFSYAMSFFIDEDNKVGLIWDNNMGVRVYIVGEDYYREIVVGEKGICLPLMCCYVPSLLQI
ncbi:hypothetical protein HID58_053963, partial [Brassica napus]